MRDIVVRPAEPQDAETYTQWLAAASDINLCDTNVYNYPTCNTAVVDVDGEPILMNSFHLVLMMEALAPKPGEVHSTDRARALKELFAGIRRVAEKSGVKEVWFGCSDPRVQKFVERHGVERVSFPMFRMKI